MSMSRPANHPFRSRKKSSPRASYRSRSLRAPDGVGPSCEKCSPVNTTIRSPLSLTIGLQSEYDPRWPTHPKYQPFCALTRSEEHTSELQSQSNLVCRLLLEKKKKIITT